MFNMQYYVGLVAPLQTVDQVCALLDDPAVRRKYGSQCEEMKQHWLASKQVDAKLLSEIDDDMITEGELAPIPVLTDAVTELRTPPGTFHNRPLQGILQSPIIQPTTAKGNQK